jgi:hypothetical protein
MRGKKVKTQSKRKLTKKRKKTVTLKLHKTRGPSS